MVCSSGERSSMDLMKPGTLKIWSYQLVKLAGFVVLLFGLLELGSQVLSWLKDGYWTPLELRQLGSVWNESPVWPNPTFKLKGIERIVAWILDWPLALTALIVGSVIALIGQIGLNNAKDEQLG